MTLDTTPHASEAAPAAGFRNPLSSWTELNPMSVWMDVNPLSAWTELASAYSDVAVASNEIILRRTHRMATGAMTPPEAFAMIWEKGAAFAVASEGAVLAAARGQDPAKIMTAALEPYGAKTRENIRDLRG